MDNCLWHFINNLKRGWVLKEEVDKKNIHLRKSKYKRSNIFSQKLNHVLLIFMISLVLLSSISYASDGSSGKEFTFLGDGESPTDNADDIQDELVESDDNMTDVDLLDTNITAKVINNKLNHVTIEVNVSDVNNNSVSNGSITVKNQNETMLEDVEIENDSVRIDLNFTSPGDYELIIVYNPSDGYNSSEVMLLVSIENGDADTTSQPGNTSDANQNLYSSNNISSSDSYSSSSSYIGNANSHKFHSSDCQEITKMNSQNKVTFNSRQEAVNNGYKPCKKCNP